MKKSKLILCTKILAIIAICLVSFVGVYVQKLNRFENVVKEYSLSKDLKGYREIILKVSDANKVLDSNEKVVGDTDTYDEEEQKEHSYKKSEEKVNSQDSLTTENYQKSKKIIEKRLKVLGIEDYNISLDKKTGLIYIQLPENSDTDTVVSNIAEIETVELKDADDEKELLKKENFKEARVTYGSTEDGKQAVILQLEFDKEGTEILKDLSQNEYKTLTEEEKKAKAEEEKSKTAEKDKSKTEKGKKEETTEEKTEEVQQKKVAIYISGSKALDFSFSKPVLDGKISELSLGNPTTDMKVLEQYDESAHRIASLLNTGHLPLKYKIDENQYVSTDISNESIKTTVIVFSVLVGIALIFMIIKYKTKGLLNAICFGGFIGLYLLLLRYTNVTIALEGIIGIFIITILNYLMNIELLKISELENKKYNKEYLNIILKLLPILAVSIVFCFAKLTVLGSLGMVMFWGIILMVLYNLFVTRHIID